MTTLTASSSSSPRTFSHPLLASFLQRGVDVLLLGIMLLMLSLSLDAAHWSPGLDRLVPITLMAILAATVVSLSPYGPGFTLLYSTVTGAAAILWELSTLATGVARHQDRVYQVIQRTMLWLQQVIAGQPGSDMLVFVLLLAILIWILSFNAVWIYFREHRKWQAVLPTGLALFVNLYYAPVDLKSYFVVYLVAAMLLVLRATLMEREEAWADQGISFPYRMGFDVMRDGVLFVLLIVLLSWVLPSTFMEQDKELANPLENSWQQVKAEWNRLFNGLDYSDTETPSAASVVFTPSHPLGGARSLTNAPVMDVKTSLNRYFQATVLDTYTGQSWELRDTVNIRLSTTPLQTPHFAARRLITQTVTMRQYTNILMAAPMPVDTSVPASARIIPLGMTPEEARVTDVVGVSELAMILSEDVLQPGDTYTITSSVSFATESQLRHDATLYGDDITSRYLQLPDTVPQRVFDLAEQLAQGQDNPYDIAKAIETYVRRFPYNDQIPGPGPGQDAADYFLFEEKQGYCDYYATAMAVMLRHLGIPTRLAQGYATGQYDALTDSYRLVEKDAHTWVEVYFPTYGWIPFEPTSSEPVVERVQDKALLPTPTVAATGEAGKDQTSPNQPKPREKEPLEAPSPVRIEQDWTEVLFAKMGYVFLALVLAGLGALLYGSVRWWRSRSSSEQRTPSDDASSQVLARMWQQVLWWGRRLGVPVRPSQTPYEQAQVFAQTMPEVGEDVQVLARFYAWESYSPHRLSSRAIQDAHRFWRRTRGRFLRAWLLGWWRR